MEKAELLKQPYDKGKVGKILFAIFTVCAAAYLLLLFWTNQRVIVADVSRCEMQSADRIEWKIEKMLGKHEYMTIKGYAYQRGVSVDTTETVLIAYDEEKDIYYELPTECVKKTKLTKKADDGCNYDYAGFRSVVLLKKVPRGSKVYIRYRGNGTDVLIPTDEVINY